MSIAGGGGGGGGGISYPTGCGCPPDRDKQVSQPDTGQARITQLQHVHTT